MRVCWVKLNGWTDTFNERVTSIADNVDEVVLIKPGSEDTTLDPPAHDSLTVLDLWPSRKPVLNPRYRVLLYPLWVLQTVLLFFWYERRYGRLSVVHSIDHPFGALAVRLVTLVDERPSVASVRGMHLSNVSTDQYDGVVNRLRAVLTKGILSSINHVSFTHADYVVTKARFQIRYLRKRFGIDSIPMSSIPTGVDLEMFDPSAVEPDRELLDTLLGGSSEDRTVVLCLGRMVPSKGVSTLLRTVDAADLPKSVEVLLVGAFPNEEYATSVEQFVAENDLGDRVTIHDSYVPFERVPGLIAAVDAVCLLSKPGVEGVPRILQEACVMETPVIASDVEGIRGAFAGHTGCFLVPREDPPAFAAALDRLDDERPLRAEFSDAFDLHTNYRRYARIYRLVSRRHRPTRVDHRREVRPEVTN